MKYCGECENVTWYCKQDDYCSRCGNELTPCVMCKCGKEEINPKEVAILLRTGKKIFCVQCGQEWSEMFLASVLADTLRELVYKIAKEEASWKTASKINLN